MKTQEELKRESKLLSKDIEILMDTDGNDFKLKELITIRAIIDWVLGDDGAYNSRIKLEKYRK